MMTDVLLRWFAENQRDLPWRRQRSVYATWIAEVMLQQTQVATVIPYFERWMTRFPDLASLAEASQDEVLKHWEGLGYYRRARNIHRTARLLCEDYEAVFPSDARGLKQLPGIGSYTAGAIASFVYSEPVLAIDGNVKRLASRLFELADVTEKGVAEKLRPFLPEAHPGRFNEALIELGALRCTAKNPDCEHCPLSIYCQAFIHGTVAQYPPPITKKKVPTVTRYALLYCNTRGILLKKREDDLLGGLWGFPQLEVPPEGKVLGLVKHVYTHFRLQITAIEVQTEVQGEPVPYDRLSSLALSGVDYKILELWRTHNKELDRRLGTLLG